MYQLSESIEREESAEGQGGERYAVLICGMADSSSFYNNISFAYDMLLEKGYSPENIKVLYSDGSEPGHRQEDVIPGQLQDGAEYGRAKDEDPDAYTLPTDVALTEEELFAEQYWASFLGGGDHEAVTREKPIVNGPATKEAIAATFTELAGKVTEQDDLFVYVTDHGDRIGEGRRKESTIVVVDPDNESSGWYTPTEEITESEFGRMLGPVKAGSEVLVFDQCHSGGFANRFGRGNRVAVSACRADESSYIAHPMDGFTDAFFSALRGRDWDGKSVDADLNGDGKVSIKEAYLYTLEHDPFANGEDEYFIEHPLLISRNRDADEAFLDDYSSSQ